MQPLEDVTVIDATQALVGPMATQTFGDLGADVIKIERPGHGDLTRTYSPEYEGLSAYFVSLNRNKRSLTLDLTSEEGQTVLHDLIEEADVFMQNFSPGKAEAFGADYETLSALNDELIYCDVSGYGSNSPYSGKKSFDIILQGEAGMMSITGTEEQPARVGISICDVSGAMTATYAILTSLYHRQQTGEGQHIELSLFDTSFQWLLYHVTNYFASGEVPQRMGTKHPNLSPYQAIETADSHIVVGVISEGIWPDLCRALNREEWIDDERFATFTDRTENRGELDSRLDEIFAEKTTEEWVKHLQKYDVPCTPVNDVEEVVNDPHIDAHDMIVEMDHPEHGTVKAPANPVNFSSLETTHERAPPHLGEHSAEILSDLGYSPEEIVTLESENVI
ncbi:MULTISPECIES: CaiB/BaiF CoA-transferase family protein [Natrinema]|uniref:Crotonobetainyl-CoA:carnitine CoA-transferase /alpha-methylacyl-CoA racemase 1 n=2 Tax=Natrinema TaxID=88723 RepID=L9ZAH6_9EURY|nr:MULTISPECIES: CaiB/BaiF CoA-transferase family protein [Natrinema]ELY83409.1 crotonobetainyl-CoA:carnitine CoA-transferase /alpha-methylacyl-CoA racemase 1 [Natrinema gari JCM 14663]